MNTAPRVATPITYVVESDAAARRVLRALQRRFRARSETHEPLRTTYHDTFDWRIHADGSSLAVSARGGDTIVSWLSKDGSIRHRVRVERSPAFVGDMPDGTFRRALAEIVEMRRLLPLVETRLEGRTLRLLDDEEKTVVRVELETGSASPANATADVSALPPRLTLVPVQGYDDAHRQAVEVVEDLLDLSRTEESTLEAALAAAGIRSDAYTSKLRVHLEPEMRAVDAVVHILRTLLDTMETNEEGTREDIDSEFLHDFRVAVRRTRTCLGQLGDVLPPASLARFREEFAWLGRITGPTRDLDVYLLDADRTRGELPPAVADDLDPLWSLLRERRRAEQQALRTHLESARYRSLVATWRNVLDRAPQTAAEIHSSRQILGLATERIAARWERVLDRGGRIASSSPVAELHRLRIHCKKLRYLLEFFRSLYPPDDVGRVIADLKKLQDTLGEINDLQVQQDTLTIFAREMIRGDDATAHTLLAMGRLAEQLERRRVKQRRRFRRRFDAFAAPETRAHMHRLLRATPERRP